MAILSLTNDEIDLLDAMLEVVSLGGVYGSLQSREMLAKHRRLYEKVREQRTAREKANDGAS